MLFGRKLHPTSQTIHFLFYIIFENRKKSGSVNGCLISIDGTDCRIPQQGPAVKGNPFSSHKFAGKCALCYELGVDIILVARTSSVIELILAIIKYAVASLEGGPEFAFN